METPTKLLSFVLFSFLLLKCDTGRVGLFTGATASHEIIHTRKVLYVLGSKKVVFNVPEPSRDNGLGEDLDKWEELRRVPAGPDPLHHNGSGPKKPRNSP